MVQVSAASPLDKVDCPVTASNSTPASLSAAGNLFATASLTNSPLSTCSSSVSTSCSASSRAASACRTSSSTTMDGFSTMVTEPSSVSGMETSRAPATAAASFVPSGGVTRDITCTAPFNKGYSLPDASVRKISYAPHPAASLGHVTNAVLTPVTAQSSMITPSCTTAPRSVMPLMSISSPEGEIKCSARDCGRDSVACTL